MEKTGDVRDGESISDFSTKKAEFYDKQGDQIADEANKHLLKEPAPLAELSHDGE
jgi:hypothetical protein